MKLEDFLTPQELIFYKKLDSKSLNDIELERLSDLKEVAHSYIYNIQSIINNNNRQILFKKMLFKFSRESDDSLSYLVTTNFFNNITKIEFNNLAEVFAFIILIIDPSYEIANKYLSFVEQTNSNTKALIMCKQYSKTYNCLFDSKLLQAELILLEKEKKLNNLKTQNRKRTIIG